MSNPWLRLHNDFLDNEKLLIMSSEDRLHFIHILILKNLGVLDRDIDLDTLDRMVAVRLRISLEQAQNLRARLAQGDLVDLNTWQPLGWSTRQYKEKDSSKERTRAWREREAQKRKNEKLSCQPNLGEGSDEINSVTVTPSPVRHSDDPVTPPDTDSETDTENTHIRSEHSNAGKMTIQNKQSSYPKKYQSQSSTQKRRKFQAKTWQPESWVDRERWQQWFGVIEQGGFKLTQHQLKIAQDSLHRCVFDLGWPMAEVMDNAISRGYKKFFPLNRRGEPEKNTVTRDQFCKQSKGQSTAEDRARQLKSIQAELDHWVNLKAKIRSGSTQSLDDMILAARNKLSEFENLNEQTQAA